MVLFRHINRRERWARYLPSGEALAIALLCAGCLLIVDSMTSRLLGRALAEAQRAFATAACVDRLARPGDPAARRQELKRLCALRLPDAP